MRTRALALREARNGLGQRWSSARLGASVVAAVLGLVVLLFVDAVVRDERRPAGDDLIYERMAQHPFATHTFPFAYRVAVPWLVHVLPFSHTFSFSLLAWVCSAVAGGVACSLMLRFGAAAWVAVALGVGLVISPPLLVLSLREGRNSDAASVLVMLLGALYIKDQRPLALGITLLVGAFVRESTLFLVPFAYAYWAHRLWDRQVAARVLAVALPGAAVYIGLRLGIKTVGKDLVPGYGQGLVAGRWVNLKDGLRSWRVELRRVASAFGPLWLCLPPALVGVRFVRAGVTVLALCALSATFALDWGRVAFLAAPVIYASAGWASGRRAWVGPVLVFGLLILDMGYALHMQHSGVVRGIEGAHPPPYPVR